IADLGGTRGRGLQCVARGPALAPDDAVELHREPPLSWKSAADRQRRTLGAAGPRRIRTGTLSAGRRPTPACELSHPGPSAALAGVPGVADLYDPSAMGSQRPKTLVRAAVAAHAPACAAISAPYATGTAITPESPPPPGAET